MPSLSEPPTEFRAEREYDLSCRTDPDHPLVSSKRPIRMIATDKQETLAAHERMKILTATGVPHQRDVDSPKAKGAEDTEKNG